MQVNASETVLAVSAENDDAVVLLKNVKLEGLPFERALSEFVRVADDQGYLKDQGHVLVAHFGETTGLTQQEIENAVSGATERVVTALLLQSTKAEFEQAKTQHSQPGIELLRKQAADQGIKEGNIDEIIEQIRGRSDEKQNDNQNTPKNSENADNRPTATAAKNNQSEKNNGGGAGNSENAKGHEQESNGSSKDDKVKENNGKDEDKPVSAGNGSKNEGQSSDNKSADGNQNSNGSDDNPSNNGDENKNDYADENEDQSNRDRNNGNRQDGNEQNEQDEDEQDEQNDD
jgi:hypothetical protein